MAAAEARAAWQRTANRYFVQEDAKRAPKLACCPSSSYPQHNDSNSENATNIENPNPNFVPSNWNSINSNIPPDTRWWLQLQPNYGTHKSFAAEEEVESKVATSTLSKERLDLKNGDCPLEYPRMVSTAFTKQNFETRADEMKTVTNIPQPHFKRKVDVEDYILEADDRLVSKKTEKVCPDLNCPFTGGNKCGPWWRISDKDELASLVAQKSLEYIENCDLPRPTQTVPVSKDPFACLDSLDGSKIFSSPVSCNLHTSICNPSGYPPSSSTSGVSDEKYWLSSETGYLAKETEKLYSTTASETNLSRDQLLEALCHSQTRAREAEMAAQKAYSEKEHIFKLFFKQASHLFACKQWLHMLQLESLCLQLKIKEHQPSTIFPALPWMPLKGSEAKRKGKKKNKCNFWKYAVIFVVGLGLAGAGLFLGWLLPQI